MPVNRWGGISDWKLLKEVVAQGYDEALLCLASIETVERFNRTSVIRALQECDAGHSARLLIDAALFRVHIYVVRAFASVRHDDDRHLRAAIEFLKQPGHLPANYCPNDRASLERAICLFDAAACDPRLCRLNHMRNKLLAHWGEPNPEIQLPKYRDLFDFTRETCEIWECLAFGTETVRIDFAAHDEAHQENANAFWSVWERI